MYRIKTEVMMVTLSLEVKLMLSLDCVAGNPRDPRNT